MKAIRIDKQLNLKVVNLYSVNETKAKYWADNGISKQSDFVSQYKFIRYSSVTYKNLKERIGYLKETLQSICLENFIDEELKDKWEARNEK